MKTLFISIIATWVLVATFFSPCQAQEKFRAGYVVTNHGDTLRGQIQYTSSKLAGETCIFIKNGDQERVSFVPQGIKAYRFIDGKLYISTDVTLDGTPKKVFLEYLIQGKANVYYFLGERDFYFIAMEDGKLVEISEPVVVREQSYNNTLVQKYLAPPKYYGKLRALLVGYQDTNNKIDRVELTHKSLIGLAKDYHEQVSKTENYIVFDQKISPAKFNVGVWLGGDLQRFNFNNKLKTQYAGGIVLGARMEILNILPTNDRFFLVADIVLQQHKKYTFYNDNTSESSTVKFQGKTYSINATENFGTGTYLRRTELEADMNVLSLSVPVTINYRFLLKSFQPYVGSGLSNLYNLSQNKDFKYTLFSEKYGQTIPPFMVGLALRSGLKFPVGKERCVFVEFAYDRVANSNLNQSLRLNSQQFSFKTGFMF